MLLGRYVSINESYWALLDVATGKLTNRELPGGKKGAIGALAFAPDGKHAYITTDVRGEFRRLARVDLATDRFQWLTDDIDWDVADLQVHRDTGHVVFTVNENGATALYMLQDGNKEYRRLPTPLGIISSLEFSPDGKRLGFTLSRPDAPSDAYSLRLADNELTRWTVSEVGGLDPASFIKPQRIKFTSFDDGTIPAYYFRPRGASKDQPVPVLINIHGGPESQYRPFFSGSTQFYLNELGIAVICPNVRGSRGYGKTYLKLDNATKREDSVKDIGALLDWIAEQKERVEQQLGDIQRYSFDPQSVEILRQRLEAKLETASTEDRRFILDAVGAKVLVQGDGAWDLELQVPRGVPAAEAPFQEGVLQTVSDGPESNYTRNTDWQCWWL